MKKNINVQFHRYKNKLYKIINMDHNIEYKFNKISLNDTCSLCKNKIKNYNNNICKNCSIKIKFLYDGWDVRCVYCQFYSDYNTNNMCEYCKSN
jgi:hypothetical protein